MDVIDILNTTQDVTDALIKTLGIVAEALGLRTGWVWLLDTQSDDIYYAAGRNLPPYLQEPVRMTGATCWCIDAFRRHRLTPKNIDIMQCSRLSSATNEDQQNATGGLKYHASIPLYFQDKPLGIINVAATSWRSLHKEELSLLEAIGYQVGIAVERSRLAEEQAGYVRAEERTRLAREIHDTLVQSLTAIILQLEVSTTLVQSGKPAALDHVNKALEIARSGLEEARNSVKNLRNAALNGKSLAEALRSYARTFSSETGIFVDAGIDQTHLLKVNIEEELFRIAQEALLNVKKHSQATTVNIQLNTAGASVVMTISDNGIGFSKDNVRADSHGLISMRERARWIGGSLRIISNRKGTKVIASLPLQESVQ